MGRKELRLNCTRCGEFTHAEKGSTDNVVRCAECDKRHSTESLYMVDTSKQYNRDESGQLLEDLP